MDRNWSFGVAVAKGEDEDFSLPVSQECAEQTEEYNVHELDEEIKAKSSGWDYASFRAGWLAALEEDSGF